GVPGDGRAGAGVGVGADLDRRDQHRARAHEGAVADLGPVLVHAIVVHGDGAGPHVDLAADGGIAQVGEVVGLAARADLALLHLDEIADVNVFVQHGLGANAGERPDRIARPDHGPVDD